MTKIDFVITWVDGSDPKWLEKKQKYSGKELSELNSNSRYRDWDFLKYWFRAVEQNANWVNKVYFVTEGHLPDWLDISFEKLVVVKHSEFINQECLPTFNSSVILTNLGNISGLSENFVNFNDDMFINKNVKPTDFFKDDLPRDTGIFSPIVPARNTIASAVLNNLEILNDYFTSREVLKNNFWKYFNFKYGKHLIKNFCVLPWWRILGFYDSHIPISYKKTTFRKLYELEPELFSMNDKSRFRTKSDVTEWLMRYWQLASGDFVPRSVKFGAYYNISNNPEQIIKDIKESKHSLICINDSDEITEFEKVKSQLLLVFEEKFPIKSCFEK
ncbi:TPA: Stealth CR1 domain-containing protein [Streptococcus suis]